jgi:hypothetical protein
MKRLFGALIATVLIAVMSTGIALANHAIAGDNVAPNANAHWQVDGNPKCGDATAGGFTLKIDASILGVGNYGPIDITAYDGKHVSWAINAAYLNTYDANLVIVKGGPTAIIYQYTDPGDDADTNLTAPQNPNGAGPKYYGISHVDFCFDAKGTVGAG